MNNIWSVGRRQCVELFMSLPFFFFSLTCTYIYEIHYRVIGLMSRGNV